MKWMCSGQSQKERFFYYSIAFTPLRIYKKEHKYIPCLSLPTIFLFRLIAQRYISRGAIILALWIQHLTDGNVMSLQTNVKHELGICIVSFANMHISRGVIIFAMWNDCAVVESEKYFQRVQI